MAALTVADNQPDSEFDVLTVVWDPMVTKRFINQGIFLEKPDP